MVWYAKFQLHILLLTGKYNSGIENIILPNLTIAPVERNGVGVWHIQLESTVTSRFVIL
jgi:hypothetical protein